MPKWKEAKVVDIIKETASTKRFLLETKEEEPLEFRPGQFVTLDLPIHETRQKRWRSYSIASAPNPNQPFELCIVQLPNGAGTKYLFESIEIGSTITYKEPAGVFTLKNPIERDLVMICTGTGIAPFRSMIQNIINLEIAHQKIHLIFGTRYKADMLYLEEFKALAQSHPNFSYSIALSREKEIPQTEDSIEWTSGYVHNIYQTAYAKHRDDIQFLICGWQDMVDEAVVNLKEIGYEGTQVKMELYG